MEREKILARVASFISPARLKHSLGVEEMALKLGEGWGISRENLSLASLCHDIARELPLGCLQNLVAELEADFSGWLPQGEDFSSPELLHGPAGAALARKEFGIEEREVLRAISVHTLGNPVMTPLDKIIYLADKLEFNRYYPGVEELRELALTDLDQAMKKVLENTVAYLRQRGITPHPVTLATLEYFRGQEL